MNLSKSRLSSQSTAGCGESAMTHVLAFPWWSAGLQVSHVISFLLWSQTLGISGHVTGPLVEWGCWFHHCWWVVHTQNIKMPWPPSWPEPDGTVEHDHAHECWVVRLKGCRLYDQQTCLQDSALLFTSSMTQVNAYPHSVSASSPEAHITGLFFHSYFNFYRVPNTYYVPFWGLNFNGDVVSSREVNKNTLQNKL